MTEQQIEIAKKLMKEYGLSAESPENTLLYLGLGYGLSEDAIRSYLGRKEDSLLEKHLCMICRVLGMDVPNLDMDKDMAGQSGEQMLSDPVGRLDAIMKKHYKSSVNKEKSYGQVMEFILNDSGLSAAQIEQLRLAVQAGVPEDEVLKMAKGKKEPMEIKRCVEFFQMVQSAETKKGRRGYFK
ncbi:MAG: hypothetical protein HFG35_14050 [Eubacterium sp.]|nr:hypothetical protein [Eubacterium sp.]MCI9539361.1 hypothetical protein [Eubacterium sp.]